MRIGKSAGICAISCWPGTAAWLASFIRLPVMRVYRNRAKSRRAAGNRGGPLARRPALAE
ncbi:MAG: hypothetical protein OXU61_13295 [Gammaproteobacteria bacterium]|nr:hypothetical protein [Gammaproteobacteria bacterium]